MDRVEKMKEEALAADGRRAMESQESQASTIAGDMSDEEAMVQGHEDRDSGAKSSPNLKQYLPRTKEASLSAGLHHGSRSEEPNPPAERLSRKEEGKVRASR